MPLGQSRYFDIPGSLSMYEDMLMELVRSQKPGFSDFLGSLGGALQQWQQQKRQREMQEWQRQMAEQRVGISQEHLDIAKRGEARQRRESEYKMGLPPKQQTGEALWLANHPGKGREDYVRAMAGIAAEFKEPKVKKVELGIEDPRMKRMLQEQDKQRARLIGYAKEWRTHKQKIQKEYEKAKKEAEKTAGFVQAPDWTGILQDWVQTIPLASDRVNLMKELSGDVRQSSNQKEIYNKCRAAGGTAEECKIKAGIR